MAVLDGDTVVVDGSAFHVAGIDAPELGPWAKCWAEAALAGHARDNLQRVLVDSEGRGWQLRDPSAADAHGIRTARLVDREGYDIVDGMVVGGYAASTSGRWDWCGEKPRVVLVEEQPPYGPSLWWPTAHMFDPRAAD
jgi:endonuclease YncB( thermonuclease family)